MDKKDDKVYSELATVESQRNELTAEEFPDGAYGADIQPAANGKSTPWRKDQHVINPFGFENKELHEDLPRDYPPDYDPE
ncbi:hypothetical protein [Paenibacillus sp. GCM10027626]|uniref:hypothetical protein n=1 Tax=Paenibacillus sp. GCM10027626 TaxID=3273411 RepID=UPI0036429C1C